MGQDDNGVLIQLTEIREQMKAIPRIEQSLSQLVQLDKALAEIVVKSDGHSKQLNAMWEKADKLSDWQQSHDGAAAARLEKITEFINANVAALQRDIRDAGDTAGEAHIKIDAVVNQARGANRALTIGLAMFGTLATSMIVWVVSETYSTSRQVAVLLDRKERLESPHKGQP